MCVPNFKGPQQSSKLLYPLKMAAMERDSLVPSRRSKPLRPANAREVTWSLRAQGQSPIAQVDEPQFSWTILLLLAPKL